MSRQIKSIAWLLMICMMFSNVFGVLSPLVLTVSAWDGTSSEQFFSGTGSATSPYVISTDRKSVV